MEVDIDIYKQGWLHKRGEHIKTWRARYFILKSNGYFLGYNNKPMNRVELDSPNNIFYIKDCRVSTSDKPKPNVFILKCSTNENNTIERFFAAYKPQERNEWLESIQHISSILNGNFLVEKSSNNFEKITLHDFEYLKILGKGTFGKVILSREKKTKCLYAIKILKKSLILEKNEINHTKTENLVLRSLKHPFITSLVYSFQTSDLLCLCMEYVNGGELFFHLTRERRFSENKSRFYCAEICYAIGYLHQNNIIYRDIKLENILLDSQGHIKLADFGLCKMNMNFDSKTDTFCGTLEYLAPEIILRDRYTRSVDWWAIGVVLYEMLVGRMPFSCRQNHQGLFDKILKEELKLPLDLSAESRLVLNQLLEKDARKRLGSSYRDFDEVKNHQFFSSIDWDKLALRELEPPFKPNIQTETDTCYFDNEFTSQSTYLTPTEDKMFDKINEINYFDSFSYYGSKTSLLSRKSTRSIEKFDADTLITEACSLEVIGQERVFYHPVSDNSGSFEEFLKELNKKKNESLDKSSFLLALNAFPNLIQSTEWSSSSSISNSSSRNENSNQKQL